jgi:hypothetical protein
MLEGDHALLVQAAMPVCTQYGLALAGGYAIKAHGLVDRPSDDVDFATGHLLRDQLDRALMYPDEEFAVYGYDAAESAAIRAWAQAWSTRLSMEIAEGEPWVDDE